MFKRSMNHPTMDLETSRKRRKANSGLVADTDPQLDEDASSSNARLEIDSTRRSISPPVMRRRQPIQNLPEKKHDHIVNESSSTPSSSSLEKPVSSSTIKMIPSPVQLSSVDELPTSSNIDTVSLKDILGDPLIKECWLFNYLFDVDFVM